MRSNRVPAHGFTAAPLQEAGQRSEQSKAKPAPDGAAGKEETIRSKAAPVAMRNRHNRRLPPAAAESALSTQDGKRAGERDATMPAIGNAAAEGLAVMQTRRTADELHRRRHTHYTSGEKRQKQNHPAVRRRGTAPGAAKAQAELLHQNAQRGERPLSEPRDAVEQPGGRPPICFMQVVSTDRCAG